MVNGTSHTMPRVLHVSTFQSGHNINFVHFLTNCQLTYPHLSLRSPLISELIHYPRFITLLWDWDKHISMNKMQQKLLNMLLPIFMSQSAHPHCWFNMMMSPQVLSSFKPLRREAIPRDPRLKRILPKTLQKR